MSPDHTDEALLRQYVTHGSEAAFAQLVQRHHGLVYETCRRELGDADLAEDAAQAVLLILARKAPSLRANSSLTGWLFQTARFAAKNLGKQERRRRQRESQAAESAQGASPQAGDLWERLEPPLNDALARLGQGEREAVLMRFFEGQSLAEVGAALGVSENAARMRVTRAIDRIRRLLARAGVSLTAAALAALIAEKAGEANPPSTPEGCAPSYGLARASAQQLAQSAQQLAQGVLRAMWIKTVLTAAAIAALIVAAVTVPLAAQNLHAVHPTLQPQAATASLNNIGGPSAAGVPKPPVAVNFEVRNEDPGSKDEGDLYMLIHAEGGMDPATKTLHQVTLLLFNRQKQVETVYQAASVQTQVDAVPGQPGEQRTTLTLNGPKENDLLGEKKLVPDTTRAVTGVVIQFLQPAFTIQPLTSNPVAAH